MVYLLYSNRQHITLIANPSQDNKITLLLGALRNARNRGRRAEGARTKLPPDHHLALPLREQTGFDHRGGPELARPAEFARFS